MFELYPHQRKAVDRMHNGCILVGDVGTGKSRTALAYFVFRVCGGHPEGFSFVMDRPRDLYIITTAKKRDSAEWLCDGTAFGLSLTSDLNIGNVNMTIDSWNNIKKYVDVKGAFFIFDEQRVVGSGAWVKAFYKITKKNRWILLSATPGDTWSDYIPVFVANGFYRNKTDFNQQHVIFSPFVKKYPKIDRYVNTKLLEKERDAVLVEMAFEKETDKHHTYIWVPYDKVNYKRIWKDRWDPYENEPIAETGKLFYLLRRCANGYEERINAVKSLFGKIKDEKPLRAIIFYNFTYELNMLIELAESLSLTYAQWNGLKHELVPDCDEWVYFVQYTAGAEGWNCITTDTVIFYSQTYSYRTLTQAAGRIDRLTTPYKDLYYYHFVSAAPIDLAIRRALRDKKNFNERSFLKE